MQRELLNIFNSNCEKCQRIDSRVRQITPGMKINLCQKCYTELIRIFTIGSVIAHGDLKHRPEYTNKLRKTLARWYLSKKIKFKLSKYLIREALKIQKFNIIPPKNRKLAGPWEHDFRNHCIKCNKAFHLQRHHITYSPPVVVFLCEKCHSRITGINTRAAALLHTSKKFKPFYTNKVRIVLWRWFLNSPPSIKRLSKTFVRELLTNAGLNPSEINSELLESNSIGT